MQPGASIRRLLRLPAIQSQSLPSATRSPPPPMPTELAVQPPPSSRPRRRHRPLGVRPRPVGGAPAPPCPSLANPPPSPPPNPSSRSGGHWSLGNPEPKGCRRPPGTSPVAASPTHQPRTAATPLPQPHGHHPRDIERKKKYSAARAHLQ